MTHHVHLVVIPHESDSLAAGLGRAYWRYSQMASRLNGRSGHLWHGRFFLCAPDEAHAHRALVHVEGNPIRAKKVRYAWDYPWSSAGAHVGEKTPPEWLEMKRWRRWTDAAHWKKVLQ